MRRWLSHRDPRCARPRPDEARPGGGHPRHPRAAAQVGGAPKTGPARGRSTWPRWYVPCLCA